MTLVSVESLKQTNPDLPVCIVTNVCEQALRLPFWQNGHDTWSYLPQPTDQNRLVKTSVIDFSPYEKSIYLDGDTIIEQDLSLAWLLLDYFDLAIRHLSGGTKERPKGKHVVLDGKARLSELTHWNGGVFLFQKNDRVREFFHLWRSCYEALSLSMDQVSLVEAIFRSDCRVLSLDKRWNAGPLSPSDRGDNAVRVRHYKGNIPLSVRKKMLGYDRFIPSNGPYGGEVSIPDYLHSRRTARLMNRGVVASHLKTIQKKLRGMLKR